ncbi:MAG: ABC-F family ATP-binding cassette domain-containing protein [Planctomycetes bacterium]|nr:ABC-F family ATP-binding cassette domain-containing protein [Planctomycetota bacterium]
MSIVRLQNVHVDFGGQTVLDELEWSIQRGEKVGLVGPNGSGKTTLFRLMLGELPPQIGTVTRSRGLQVAYLPQEPTLDSTNTLFAEVSGTFDNVHRLEDRVAEVAQLISEHHGTAAEAELMAEYDELTHRLEAAGGYEYEVTLKEVLGGLGFTPADYELPIAALSGGQKCRAALARLLLQEADLLLLDEPTNHLDIAATRFLEKFLAGYHGAAVIVSHDRYLLDRVVEKIANLDERRITVYPCAYSDFAEAKRVRLETAQREYEKQREWMQHQREYAERVKADKSRSAQARGRLKALDRLERSGTLVERPIHARRRMAIDFVPTKRAGDMVLRAVGVRKAYGSVVLFDGFNLEVFRGEKIGIIGPNGVGKTTLLKMAMRRVPPDAGEVRLFENLDVGYYDQEHADLNENVAVIDEIETRRPGSVETEVRSFLARFLFFGDDVYKRVGSLSGGEQSRVVLAKLMWRHPQVLVLDEPTNHLDIPAREALEDALIAYDGAILLVSHDRYFLDRVVNELLVLPERGCYELLPGNWSTYEARVAAEEAARRAAEEQARRQQRQANRQRGQRRVVREAASGVVTPYANWSLDQLEEAIIDREQRLAAAEAQFADPAVYRDADRSRTLRAAAQSLRHELAQLNAAWEALADEAE